MLVATERGYAKRTDIDEYPVQGRGGKGVLTIQYDRRRGKLVGALIVELDTEVYAITSSGGVIRTLAKEVRKAKRQTMGVRLMNLSDGDSLVAIARNADAEPVEDAVLGTAGPAGPGTARLRRRGRPTDSDGSPTAVAPRDGDVRPRARPPRRRPAPRGGAVTATPPLAPPQHVGPPAPRPPGRARGAAAAARVGERPAGEGDPSAAAAGVVAAEAGRPVDGAEDQPDRLDRDVLRLDDRHRDPVPDARLDGCLDEDQRDVLHADHRRRTGVCRVRPT